MSKSNIETVSSVADRLRVALALSAFLAGLVGWYVLAGQPLVLRLAVIIGACGLALAVIWTSLPGRRAMAFGRDAWTETRRVVWPTRKEAWMVTLYVFGFVLLMALFLWVVDKTLEWVLYDLILGWKR